MLVESRGHAASKVLRQIPTLGTVRIAQLIAAVATPHRFRSERQFWP
jgi:transposase